MGQSVRIPSMMAGMRVRDRQLKKDAMWKPLIRLFRRFLKKDVLSKATYEMIHSQPIVVQGKLFASALGVPPELQALPKTYHIILMIISSHRITRRKQLVPQALALMGRYSQDIWNKYYEIFNENCHRDRLTFFSDPLIQFLWEKLRASNKGLLTQQLSKQIQELDVSKV